LPEKELNEGHLHRHEVTPKPAAEINPTSRITWLQSKKYFRVARPSFKQLRRFGKEF
jgi:hypothetical protein